MNEKITIIFGYRDREVERVKRSLDSLACQSNKNFKVIFIDYGSQNTNNVELINLLEEYPFCKYMYNDTRGRPWNRSHALNTGIRISETEFIFTADIDMIFKKNFIEKLSEVAKDNCVSFFQVYYLPEKFSNWKNIGSQKYETSKKFALGLALLPVKIINKIGGYDEFYCYWGLEDNDMESRLNIAGIKSKFFDEEVLMYHQWHELSIASQKDFPKGWGSFQNDYFISKVGVVKRNEDREWGKIFLENERSSIKTINKPLTKFIVVNGSVLYFIYELNRQFKNLNSQEAFCLEFNDVNSAVHLQSRLGKTISFFQQIFHKLKIPIKLVSQYRHLYATVYEIRDNVMIFLLSYHAEIADYSILVYDNKLRLIIIKK